MASILTVSDTIQFVSTFVKQQRLYVNNFQPAVGIANIVLGRMLAPPCTWRFNRAVLNFAVTQAGGTDYAQTLSTLGWIETQWLMNASGQILQLDGAVELSKNANVRRPKRIAPVYDNGQGAITFRLDSVPDQNYTVYLDTQNKAPLLLAPSSSFYPVPDEFSFIFNLLYLAWAGMLVNDARFPIWMKDGIGALLGAQAGLDAQAKAILIGDWMNAFKTVERNQQAAQMGTAATGM